MLSDLVNGGGCDVEARGGANNALAKLSQSIIDGPARAMGKQPMVQQSDGGRVHAGLSSMHATLPQMGREEEAFLQAFQNASLEDLARHDAAWQQSSAAAAHDSAWAEAQAAGEAMAAQEAAWLQPAQQEAGQAIHGVLRGMMGNPKMPAVPTSAVLATAGLPPQQQAAAARRADMVAAHLRPAGAERLWEARPADGAVADPTAGSSQLQPVQPPWRRPDVDSFPPRTQGMVPVPPMPSDAEMRAIDSAHAAAWAVESARQQPQQPQQPQTQGTRVPQSVTAPIIAAMQSSTDPRFEQSQLLDFLKQASAALDSGAVRVDAGELHRAQGAEPATTTTTAAAANSLEAAWGASSSSSGGLDAVAAQQARMEAAWQQAAGGPLDASWLQAGAATGVHGGVHGGGEGLQAAWQATLHDEGIDASLPEMEALWESLKGGLPLGGEHASTVKMAVLAAPWLATTGLYENAWEQSLDELHDEYSFAPTNPYLGKQGLLQIGTALFRRGELSQAVLALEAAVQANPEDSIAWQTLGQTHADSDEDTRAISCLRRAVASDPHNLDALLSLGVSYTNELDQSRALHHLQHWLESHPDFASLDLAVEPAAATNPFRLQQQVIDNFSRAVAHSEANADLHAVLGVLNNLSRDYPAAVREFERALQLRPKDYSLWNKLGATRANSMECEKALPCYINALECKPQFVRALSNLGISYSNMTSYDAAASCYLKALDLNPQANHIWTYLGMTLTSMGRPDLVEKAALQDPNAFRGDFDF